MRGVAHNIFLMRYVIVLMRTTVMFLDLMISLMLIL